MRQSDEDNTRVCREALTKLWKGIARRDNLNGGVAQLGEHLPCKQGVRSSILLISTSPGDVREDTKRGIFADSQEGQNHIQKVVP